MYVGSARTAAGAAAEQGNLGGSTRLDLPVRTPSRPEGLRMFCPFCRHQNSRVVDSREADDGNAIRRRRQCPECGRRFTTVETSVLAVVKRSGVTEPFSRDKVIQGVRRACQGRDVNEDQLAQLAHRVEDTVRASGSAEIPSHEVGLAILGPLRELDEVAYLRFASVYRSFSSAEDFEREIEELRALRHRKQAEEDSAAVSEDAAGVPVVTGGSPRR